ncbi:hypothetical protein KEF85_03305 [Methylomonas paludis]|uniref:Uncharacterized protein n=1 Tax=Methylomonas paludis TaxID=1173101 RepID=A0A975MP96_9GAMM|nr:hypothetical protein [Methylomonas paludis]QWF71521.1 hypothetical protein KEF85_03305 [Methylomonas paludis]
MSVKDLYRDALFMFPGEQNINLLPFRTLICADRRDSLPIKEFPAIIF